MAAVREAVASALAQFNDRFKETPPAVLVAATAAAIVAAQTVAPLAANPSDTAEAAKVALFKTLRRYFGDRLGYDKAMKEARIGFLEDFAKQKAPKCVHDVLPAEGLTREAVLEQCKELSEMNADFSKGQFSGSVYHGGDNGYTEFIGKAMTMHQWTNPLHGGQFGGVRRMEAEILSMVKKMFHGGPEVCGTMTTGGTESILLAMKAYREMALDQRGIQRFQGELVVPVTAHAAFDKASHYFGFKIRHARMDPVTCKVDLKHMRSLISRNTIGLVASAPHFPHGVIDPVEAIVALGKEFGLPVHVDCCLGGFILPFMEEAGLELDERFDFRVDGVTSVSCDMHKYGFAPKGSSCVMYRSSDVRKYQMHSQPNWPGGIYASPTISGSRIGNVIAGTWAAMLSHGRAGYVREAGEIVRTARYLRDELEKVPGMKVMGKPYGSVVAFASDEFDIYKVLGSVTEKGWELNALQYPSSLHICVTRLHTKNNRENAKRLMEDIKEAAAEAMKTKNEPVQGGLALYGTSQQIPDRSIIGDVAMAYFDAYYTADVEKAMKELQEQ